MPSPILPDQAKPKRKNRKHSHFEPSTLHCVISNSSHEFLRKLANSRKMTIGAYLDHMLQRNIEKTTSVQKSQTS